MTSANETQTILHPRRKHLGLGATGLRMSERRLLLGFVDYFIMASAVVASLWLRSSITPTPSLLLSAWKWFATLAVIWFGVAIIFDLYNLARAASTTYSARNTALAGLLASVVYVATPWLTPPVESRTQAFLFVGLATIGVTLWRIVYAQLFVQPAFERRALAVGAGVQGEALIQTLRTDLAQSDANPYRGTGYILVGFVDDAAAELDGVSAETPTISGVPILGRSNQIVRLARTLDIDEIVLTVDPAHDLQPDLFEALLDCRELGIPVTKMSTVYERQSGRVPLAYAGRDLEMATTSSDNPFVRLFGLVKRLFDIVGALFGSLLLVLMLPFVWISNRLFAPGPLFFKQNRVGYGGRPFHILKFRTMVPDAELRDGAVWAVWAADGDCRITPVGRWLRWSHLDELPQVVNVLRGEMSLVGPRPERPEFVGELARQIPFYRARHSLLPGITGWAQIHQDYGDSVEGAREKLEYDLYYIKHANPLLDLLILLRTVTKVCTFQGR